MKVEKHEGALGVENGGRIYERRDRVSDDANSATVETDRGLKALSPRAETLQWILDVSHPIGVSNAMDALLSCAAWQSALFQLPE